jgi:hypothetical protein
MQHPSHELFPTGQRSFQFDLSEHIAKQVGTITIASATWTLPPEISEVASTTTDSAVTATFSTAGLSVNDTYTAICAVTFSDGQVHQFEVPLVIGYLNVKVAT